jgi:hypothetical protein
MVPQINSVCKCTFFHLLIGRIRKYLDVRSVKLLVHALVLSRIDYANSLLFGLPKSLLVKLQRVQNAAARLIVGVGNTVKKLTTYFGVLRPNISAKEIWGCRNLCIVSQYEIIGVKYCEFKLEYKAIPAKFEPTTFDLAIRLDNHYTNLTYY